MFQAVHGVCITLLFFSLIFSLRARVFCARMDAGVRSIARTRVCEKMCVLTFVNTAFCLSGINVHPRNESWNMNIR